MCSTTNQICIKILKQVQCTCIRFCKNIKFLKRNLKIFSFVHCHKFIFSLTEMQHSVQYHLKIKSISDTKPYHRSLVFSFKSHSTMPLHQQHLILQVGEYPLFSLGLIQNWGKSVGVFVLICRRLTNINWS